MLKRDGEEFIGLIIGLIVVVAIIYIICLLASLFISIAAAGGTLFGGGSAIKNYCESFKENVIDSNRVPMAA